MLLSPDPGRHCKMTIAIGESKVLRATALGYELVLKHRPDCAFFLHHKAGERTKRAFLKPLRYEATQAGRFPNFLLLDAGERPLALDILSPFPTDRERAAKASAIAARNPKGWARDTAQGMVIPELPGHRPVREGPRAATSPAASHVSVPARG